MQEKPLHFAPVLCLFRTPSSDVTWRNSTQLNILAFEANISVQLTYITLVHISISPK